VTTTLVAAMVLIAAAAAGVPIAYHVEAPERFGTLLIDALGRMSGPDRKRH
jgi:hypothetical protein